MEAAAAVQALQQQAQQAQTETAGTRHLATGGDSESDSQPEGDDEDDERGAASDAEQDDDSEQPPTQRVRRGSDQQPADADKPANETHDDVDMG
jgi:hypothetical protein